MHVHIHIHVHIHTRTYIYVHTLSVLKRSDVFINITQYETKQTKEKQIIYINYKLIYCI